MTLTSKVYNLAFVNFKHSEMLGKKEFNEPHRLRSYLFKKIAFVLLYFNSGIDDKLHIHVHVPWIMKRETIPECTYISLHRFEVKYFQTV